MSVEQRVAWFTQVCQLMHTNPQEASQLITEFRITAEALPIAKYIIGQSSFYVRFYFLLVCRSL